MSAIDLFEQDNKLLRLLSNGDTQAFRLLYKQCFPLVKRAVLNMNGQIHEAEDVYHASLLVLYSKAKEPEFKLTCKISTFLVAVARKKWLKELEKKKRLTQKEQNYAMMHNSAEVDNLIDWNLINEQSKKKDKLKLALEKLGSPCKEIIISFYINDLSMKEIADRFDYTNADNAKTQKHKCLQRLKKIFFEINK